MSFFSPLFSFPHSDNQFYRAFLKDCSGIIIKVRRGAKVECISFQRVYTDQNCVFLPFRCSYLTDVAITLTSTINQITFEKCYHFNVVHWKNLPR